MICSVPLKSEQININQTIPEKGRTEFIDIIEISLFKQLIKTCFIRKRNT